MSDTVTWYLLLVGGGSYPVELVKVRKSWPRHHAPKKKKKVVYRCSELRQNFEFRSSDFICKATNDLWLSEFLRAYSF